MDEITVRPGCLEDWPTIAEFNGLLAHETEDKSLERQAVESGVRALLADPHKGRYLVACAGERIIGQVMHTREWSDWRNGDIWWLQSVYIHPDYRRRGVFRQLYERLRGEAEADPQVVGLRLYVERENEQAHHTYRGLGMTECGYFVMERMFS